jgi:hypothetical protein
MPTSPCGPSGGGFNRSSQHLDSEGLRWERGGVDGQIVLAGRRCGHPAGGRWGGASTSSGSGRRSPAGSRARRPASPPGCLLRSESAGSATVAAWRRSPLPRCRGATCRLPNGKRSPCSGPVAAGPVTSPGSWADPHQRSRGSCAATRRPAAAVWSIGPRLSGSVTLATRLGSGASSRRRGLTRALGCLPLARAAAASRAGRVGAGTPGHGHRQGSCRPWPILLVHGLRAKCVDSYQLLLKEGADRSLMVAERSAASGDGWSGWSTAVAAASTDSPGDRSGDRRPGRSRRDRVPPQLEQVVVPQSSFHSARQARMPGAGNGGRPAAP